ncbi:MAG: phosphate regulon sensor histidine kinase PhoR [Chromatiales bacterium]|nr:phosphate regulon sensor histidine kinase PhoR [Chromatiales bacterium]
MIGRGYRRELGWVLATALGLLGLGWGVGRPAAFLLLGAAAYLGWQLWHLERLRRWLERRPGVELRPTFGLWHDVFVTVERLRRKNRDRKKRLRRALRGFERAASAAPDGAVILREGGEIVWMNPMAEELLGLRRAQDIGQPIANLVRSPAFADYVSAGRFDRPLDLDSPADSGRHLVVRIAPYDDQRSLLLVRDVTRVIQLEQVRRDFIANVSHELRTPLTVLVGYLETMTDDDTMPAQYERPLRQMSEQAERMSRIVEDLLRLSRMENEPGGAPRNVVKVGDLLRRLADDLRDLSAGRHAISVQTDVESTLLGDEAEIYSAFSNIAVNAVHYTPLGGDIQVRFLVDEDGDARFEVSDSGVGIDAEHLPRLTERFYRVDKARSREVGGTGLGLAIVKHVLMRHDGHLEVTSTPGEGSTFTCCFPAERVVTSIVDAGAA